MGRDALIDRLLRDKILIRGEDGLWLFWPTENVGGWTEGNLLDISRWIMYHNAIAMAEMDRGLYSDL